MKQGGKFTLVVEGDEEGYYVDRTHPAGLPHSGKNPMTLDTLVKRVREAIEVHLGGDGDRGDSLEPVGIQFLYDLPPPLKGKDFG